jgi:hypothetical protein
MSTKHRRARVGLTSLAGSAALVAVGAVIVAMLAGASGAASTVVPKNTGEPSITGTAQVGEILTTTKGTWTGTEPITYAFRWRRCDGAGKPDASDCPRIANANNASYTLRQADAGLRIRSQIIATNADGASMAASNATSVVTSAKPTNTDPPTISGTPAPDKRLQANRGTWVGEKPITYAYRWLRCNADGDNCSELEGATDSDYVVRNGDVGRTLRVRVSARNDAGSASAISAQTAVVRTNAPPTPPPGSSIPVTQVPNTARLIVSEVRFTPNPVRSRTAPITVSIRVKDTRGNVISGALVFIRSTPRVTSGGDRQPTGTDGWVTYQLVPNGNFPQTRNGFNVQFFVKAYRAGDPSLGGVAGYRLVQVRLAG